MRSVKFLVAAGAASLLSSGAFAADMAIMPPPAYAPPPIVEDFGGWYLRGDIGFSNQRVDRLNNALDTVGAPSSVQRLSFNTAGIFGLGVGYKVNNWFRADVTGEYRGNSQFFGTDHLTYAGPSFGVNTYHATKSEWVVLGNAYVDLGTWWCVTPFIGAGVGGARVSIANFTDVNTPTSGVAFGDNVAKWNLAWAVHAGVAYKVTPNFTVELAYRYLDMGDGLTGDLRTFDGVNNVNNPTTFKNITSHDLKLGVRWDLSNPPAYAPPLMRKG
ncbi:outer membrane beta-barrel protein [Bradyrhizobium sp.]|uniref:outer membrane protein n=1 Tax=Bradyrhizobium sp. TaxID=376 RepID=UPI000AD794FD|nr:outer membrane beta-barrel protein [Bradyrhizobium sp.]